MADSATSKTPEPTSMALSRWLTLRALGLVTLIAFASFWMQAEGLIGAHGISPHLAWLDAVAGSLGDDAVWRAPTLVWWLPFDVVMAIGCVAAVGLCLGLPVEGPLLLVAWACYLSVSLVGQRFLGFQWDTLLTETLFTAMFFARWTPRSAREPSRVGTWLLRLLLFKLMLLSGLVKLNSGDPGWWDGTAMTFHYFTQPLPNGLSWFAHHLPVGIHRLETWATLFIEIGLPFAIFFGRPGRLVAAFGFTLVLTVLMLTGNYGFFQLLTLVLCIPLVGDEVWRRAVPAAVVHMTEGRPVRTQRGLGVREGVHGAVALAIVSFGTVLGLQRLDVALPLPDAALARVEQLRAARTINSYGLFADMTETRPEVLIEVSVDGRTWREWPFKYKVGDPTRRPAQIAPHMPRLDWQMWFAALGSCRRNPWVPALMQRLLDEEPSVMALVGPRPTESAPTYARAMVSTYHFTEPGEKGWWERSKPRPYCPTITRP